MVQDFLQPQVDCEKPGVLVGSELGKKRKALGVVFGLSEVESCNCQTLGSLRKGPDGSQAETSVIYEPYSKLLKGGYIGDYCRGLL